jgi:hypothetical protein
MLDPYDINLRQSSKRIDDRDDHYELIKKLDPPIRVRINRRSDTPFPMMDVMRSSRPHPHDKEGRS